jgi:hypothetical protein
LSVEISARADRAECGRRYTEPECGDLDVLVPRGRDADGESYGE